MVNYVMKEKNNYYEKKDNYKLFQVRLVFTESNTVKQNMFH
jgi:hypothetical protein